MLTIRATAWSSGVGGGTGKGLAGDHPGNEIQSPMAEVILGGLLSSTFLNLVVVPALFARWGGTSSAQAVVKVNTMP